MLSIIILLPFLTAFEQKVSSKPKVYPVTTSLIVEAPIHTVWNQLLEFNELNDPKEFVFKYGISYPN